MLKSEFSSVLRHCLPEQIHSLIGCISTIFLLSEFSNVFSKCLPEQMQSCIGCICSREWVFRCCQTACLNKCIVTLVALLRLFFQSEFSNVFSSCLPEQMHSHIGCIWMTFLQCEFSNVSSNCLSEQLRSRIGCIKRYFFRVSFQMSSLPNIQDITE